MSGRFILTLLALVSSWLASGHLLASGHPLPCFERGSISAKQLKQLRCYRGVSRLRGGGISGFQRWFTQQFPSAVIKATEDQHEEFDHVLFDMNGLLHTACRKAKDFEHAILRVYKELDATLRTLIPTKSVVLAFDGPGPLAKLLTQRKRRNKSSKASKYKLSGLHITPGTKFMQTMREACEYYAALRLVASAKFKNVAFYISGADVAGEGEIKIIEWIHNLLQNQNDEKIIIVGGDADLVLQGLAVLRVKDLFVYAGKDMSQHPSSRKAKGKSSPSIVLSMWEVVRSLERLFPGQSQAVRADLIVLMIMNGNDYLPKVRGGSFESFFRAYKKVKSMVDFKDRFLLNGSEKMFDWKFLHAFMSLVQKDVPPIPSYTPLDILDRMADTDSNVLQRQDYVSELSMYYQRKYKQSAAELNVSSSQLPNTNWQCTIMWEGKAFVGEPERSIRAAKQNAAKEVLIACGIIPDDKAQLEEEAAMVGNGRNLTTITQQDKQNLGIEPAEMSDEGGAELVESYEKALNESESEEAELDEDDNLAGSSLPEDDEEEDEDWDENFEYENVKIEYEDMLKASQIPLDNRAFDKVSRMPFNIPDYFESLLWNIQMYIDGYVPDYFYTYNFKFAPDAKSIVKWIESEDFAPFPELNIPYSECRALQPLHACLAMMPSTSPEFVPKAYQSLICEPSSRLYQVLNVDSKDFDVPEFLDIMNTIDGRLLTPEEEIQTRDNGCWSIFFRTNNYRMSNFARGRTKAQARDPDEVLLLGLSQPKVTLETLTETNMPQPPNSKTSKFRKIFVRKPDMQLLKIQAQDFPPCLAWPTLERMDDDKSLNFAYGDILSIPYARPFRIKDPPSVPEAPLNGTRRNG